MANISNKIHYKTKEEKRGEGRGWEGRDPSKKLQVKSGKKQEKKSLISFYSIISTVTEDTSGRCRMKGTSLARVEAGVNTTIKFSLPETVIFQSLGYL